MREARFSTASALPLALRRFPFYLSRSRFFSCFSAVLPYSASINWYRFARLYTLFLVVLIVLLRLKGENWWPSSFLIFIPPQVWLLPWFALLYGLKKAGPRFLLPLGAALVVWAFGIAGFSLGLGARSPGEGAETLTVVTNNVGEHNGQSIRPFIKAHQPDLILYQEYIRKPQPTDFEGYHSRVYGTHVLVSRYPILDVKTIPGAVWRRSAGVVFTIDWKGRPIHVYSIHIPTARVEYTQLWKKGRPTWRQRLRFYRDAMAKRVAIGEKLAQTFAEDPLPVIVAGDFNMPSTGYLHRYIASRVTDAFSVAGRGFGYTFPGYDPYLPTWFGTWLRLDYIFTNNSWRPIAAKAEKGRASQHRATLAVLEWTPPPSSPAPPLEQDR